jgi:hypothetical protein
VANTILTTRMAGIIGELPMAEASAPVSDKYPAYRFHPTLGMVLVENEAEDTALPAGYRDKPYTEEEADAYARDNPPPQPEESPEPHTRRSHR